MHIFPIVILVCPLCLFHKSSYLVQQVQEWNWLTASVMLISCLHAGHCSRSCSKENTAEKDGHRRYNCTSPAQALQDQQGGSDAVVTAGPHDDCHGHWRWCAHTCTDRLGSLGVLMAEPKLSLTIVSLFSVMQAAVHVCLMIMYLLLSSSWSARNAQDKSCLSTVACLVHFCNCHITPCKFHYIHCMT